MIRGHAQAAYEWDVQAVGGGGGICGWRSGQVMERRCVPAVDGGRHSGLAASQRPSMSSKRHGAGSRGYSLE